MREIKCPALTHGSVAVCRFCIFTGGGPSALCVSMAERHHKNQATKFVSLPVPPSPNLSEISLEAE